MLTRRLKRNVFTVRNLQLNQQKLLLYRQKRANYINTPYEKSLYALEKNDEAY